MNMSNYLKDKKKIVDKKLKDLFSMVSESMPPMLSKSLDYSLFAGGKRIRPILTYVTCEAFGGDIDNSLTVGCAIEFIHTYSLIHDDLPAMDNDDYRRGKLTNHKVFGDAIAILAGDALLTEAFNILTNKNFYKTSIDTETILDITNFIANCAGGSGMVGGQVYDILFENKKVDKNIVEQIHTLKTARLITASIYSGARLGTDNSFFLEKVKNFAMNIGLSFQIIDDILDITGDFDKLGKDINSDIDKNKATYPAVFGLEESKKLAVDFTKKAIQEIEFLNEKSIILKELAIHILNRIQ